MQTYRLLQDTCLNVCTPSSAGTTGLCHRLFLNSDWIGAANLRQRLQLYHVNTYRLLLQRHTNTHLQLISDFFPRNHNRRHTKHFRLQNHSHVTH